jgi:drug/metabolite transporter (DMT)-like permease
MDEGAAVGRSPQVMVAASSVVTAVMWSSSFLGIREIDGQISAGPLALGRLIVASVCLGVGMRWHSFVTLRRGHLLRIAIVGISWFAAYNLLLNRGELFVDAGTAAMVISIGPLLIALGAGVFLREGFRSSVWFGGAVAIAGIAILTWSSADARPGAREGALLCLSAAIAYAIGALVQKPLLATTSPLTITWTAAMFGAVSCMPFAPALVREVRAAPPRALVWMVYLGVVPTALGFIVWAYGLARGAASRVAATMYVVAPLSVVLGWLVLGETPTQRAMIGGVLAMVGAAMAGGACSIRSVTRRSIPPDWQSR